MQRSGGQCPVSVINYLTTNPWRQNKMTKEHIIKKVEDWITQSVEATTTTTGEFHKDEKLPSPQPFQRTVSASLVPITNETSSVLIQVIIWSHLSDS